MAVKDVRFSVDARDRMLRGVDILPNAVGIGTEREYSEKLRDRIAFEAAMHRIDRGGV
jgi:hypothetical protein